jgi:hypothetical protein
MSGVSSVSSAVVPSYVAAQADSTKAVVKTEVPKPAPASAGTDSDGDYDGGRIDVQA